MANEIPKFEMPDDPMRAHVIREMIKHEVGSKMFDKVSGVVLDIRTCVAFFKGDDELLSVHDPELMRKLLARDDVRAGLLKRVPGIRVLFMGEADRHATTEGK